MCAWPGNSKMVFHDSVYFIPKATGTLVSEENAASYQKLNFCQCLLEGLCNFNWKDFKHRKDLHLLLWRAAVRRKGYAGMHEAFCEIAYTLKAGHSLRVKEILYPQVFCVWRELQGKNLAAHHTSCLASSWWIIRFLKVQECRLWLQLEYIGKCWQGYSPGSSAMLARC